MIGIFHTPHAHALDVPAREIPVGILPRHLLRKTRMVGLPDDKNSLGTRYSFRYEGERQTDGRTPHDSIGRDMHSVARQKSELSVVPQ